MEHNPLRVGAVIGFEPDDGGNEFSDIKLVRKDLPCTRWLAQCEDGHYVIVFANERTRRMWVYADSETMRLNGEV